MADVAGADTPAAPAPQPEPAPQPGVQVTEESQIVSSITDFLHHESDTQEPETESPVVQEEAPVEDAQEAEEQAEASDGVAEADEVEVASLEELPNTLNDFAEAIGIEPDELAGHLMIPVGKDASGNVVEVTLAEAIRGNMRQADYSQKTNELAEARRQFDAGVEAARSEWQARIEQADAMVANLQKFETQDMSDAELNQLLLDDPQEYLIQKNRIEVKQKALNDAQAAREEMMKQQKAEGDRQKAEFRQREQEALYRAFPELNEDAKRTEFEGGLNTFLQSVGFSSDEISGYLGGVFDHRVIKMADMARKWSAMESGKKKVGKKLKGLPRVVKPGQARDTKASKTDAASARRNRMVRSGSEDSAVEFVQGLLNRG